MSPKRQAALGIEHALLGFVQQQPLHAYDMHQHLQTAHALGAVWRVKQAHVYAMIDRLEAEGLLDAEHVLQTGRPAKRLLRLTERGRAAFDAWVHTPVAHGRELRITFLAKLYWAQQAGPDATQQLIAAQRNVCAAWLAALQAELARLGETDPFGALVVQFRIGQTEAMVSWLDTCTTTLE